MALIVKDRVQETSTTTGTGTLTLAGAVTGFQSFSVIGNANTTYYAIVMDSSFEIGIGTYTSSGTTLSRTTVLESSNAGSLVNFSAGTKSVFCTYPAEKAIYADASDVVNPPAAIIGAANTGSVIPFYFANQAAFPSASTYHGAIAHSHADGAMYFAHSGSWVRITNDGGPLGTPSSGTATNLTGLPITTGVSGLGTNVATALGVAVGSSGAVITNGGALGTPSSGTATNLTGLPLTTGVTGTLPIANGGTGTTSTTFTNLTTNVTGTLPVANGGTGVTSSTGTTAVVLSTSPTLVTPVLGVATATSVNKVALTAPATSATLTIADGKTLTASNSLTLAGTDATTMTFPATSATVAGLSILETFTASQRGTVTTDNDGSFDMNVTNNFKCTPTATFALTFTNITAGQSGYVLLVNTGGYTVTAAATTKVNTSFLATVSAAGTYLLSYFTDGTNVYVTTGGAMA